MKKFWLILLALVLAFSLIACDEETGKKGKKNDDDDEEKTTISSNVTGNTGDEDTESVASSDQTGEGSNSGDVTVPTDSIFEEVTDSSAEESTDSSSEETTDSSESDTDSSTEGDDPAEGDKPSGTNPLGLLLSKAVIKQFENAASMKLGLSFCLDLESSTWEYDQYGAPTLINLWKRYVAELEMTVVKTDSGYDVKIEVLDTRTMDEKDGDYIEGFTGVVLYVIDGVMYEYNMENDLYLKSELQEIDTSELDAMLESVFGNVEISEEEMDAILSELGDMVIDAFQIKNGGGSASINFKEYYDEIVAYINGLDLTKDTLRSLVNEQLTKIDPSLTVRALVNSLYTTMGMTVEEYMAHFEKIYGMTLQELYDALVNDPTVQAFVIGMLTSEGASEAEIASFIAKLTSAKIEDLFTPDILKMTMYEFALMTFDANADEQPTLEELMAYIDSIFDMTLQGIESSFGIPFSSIKMLPSLVTLRECYLSFDVDFKNVFEIDEAGSEFDLDVTVTMPSETVSGKMDSISISFQSFLRVFNIGNENEVIELPSDANVILDVFDKEYALELVDRGYVFEYILYMELESDGNTYVELWCAVYDGYGEMVDYELYWGEITLDNINGNVVVVPANTFEGCYSEEVLAEALIFELDLVNETFIFSME